MRFLLAACLAVLPLAAALAQTSRTTTRPTARPVAKPAPRAAAPAPRAAAQPTPAPAPKPTPPPAPARASSSSSSSDKPFDVGTNAVNLGIGIGSRYSYGGGIYGGNSSVTPAFSISYERGIVQVGPGVIGGGIFAGYQSASYDFGGGDKWKYTDIIVALRGAFHYPVTDKFDAYGGVSLGVRHTGASYSGNPLYNTISSSGSELSSNLFVGGRYFFTSSIGAFAELGYDQTYLKGGLAVKF